ncbi:hypothetical protein ILUMI_04177 [Ignelater luminosus]|uniref:Uncharacterized protein n=1 Tax=Ignelater luminosus TaxID=2038154 RepID=A0A8K0DED2_IGNLU|nr:hypothetical protein ILUMI_04177 [Ignelater luminosus]
MYVQRYLGFRALRTKQCTKLTQSLSNYGGLIKLSNESSKFYLANAGITLVPHTTRGSATNNSTLEWKLRVANSPTRGTISQQKYSNQIQVFPFDLLTQMKIKILKPIPKDFSVEPTTKSLD